MQVPLLQLGPNTTYGTTYFGEGSRIIAVEGGSPTSPPPQHRSARPKTLIDRLFKIDRVFFSPAVAASEVFDSITMQKTPRRKPRRNKIISLLTTLQKKAKSVLCFNEQQTIFANVTPQQKDHNDEPHSKTTRSTRTYQAMPERPRVLANHAGTRRTDRRKQSHGVRANRSVDSQRRAHKRSEQSTLFIDC